MRLLQAMAGGRRGGAERFFARLALAFGRAHIEQRLLVRDGAACSAWLEAGGLRPVTLPFGGWLDTASARRFRREAAAFRPDVVLTWMNRASAFCPRANGFVHIGRLGGYYNLKYYRGCAHLIANTRDIADYVRREGWTRPVHYVPNFAEFETTPALPRAALATPEDVPLLLAVGRLHRNKGFDVLLKALAMVAEAHLWLAGTGPLETELERTAASLGLGDRLHLLGWRDDVAALHGAADVLVCPSRHEPLGNVIIEAWAHDTPVVAARAQGPAALIEDGVNGLLTAIDDPVELADGLRRVIKEPGLAARLTADGRTAYEAAFTEQAVVAQYLRLFEEVTAKAA